LSGKKRGGDALITKKHHKRIVNETPGASHRENNAAQTSDGKRFNLTKVKRIKEGCLKETADLGEHTESQKPTPISLRRLIEENKKESWKASPRKPESKRDWFGEHQQTWSSRNKTQNLFAGKKREELWSRGEG